MPRVYRGVWTKRLRSRWHVIVKETWPLDSAHHRWLRDASVYAGLGNFGRGYATQRDLWHAIDYAIARQGAPPAFPTPLP